MKYIIWSLLLISKAVYGLDAEGMWVGTYTYGDELDKKASFAMVLKKNGLGYTGKTLENNSFGTESADCLISTVTGEIDDQGKVKMFHKYNGDGDQFHLVIYNGVIKDGVMEGEWSIATDWKGKFSARLIESNWRFEEERKKLKQEKDAEKSENAGKSSDKM